MHPELFLIVYRQQEHERDQRLQHLQRAQERVTAPVAQRTRWLTSALRSVEDLRGRTGSTVPDAVCCAGA